MSAERRTCPAEAFNPFEGSYLADPYAFFAWARAEQPIFYSADLGYWVLTRHADIKAALRDPERFSSQNATDPFTPVGPEAGRILREGGYAMRRVLLNATPPDHTRIRRHVYAAFTPQRVAGLERRIRALARERIAALSGGRADIVAGLTYELPARVIFMLLGMPDDEVPAVKAGSESRVLFTWGRPTGEQQADLARGMVQFWQLSDAFVRRRAEGPQDDFTSDLLRLRERDPGALTLEEIVSVVFGLLLAGHETTTGLLTNALRALLAAPGRWAELAARPAGIPAAIEELLRLDTSVVAMRRLTTAEVQIGGATIPAGANVLLLIASANHDEAIFADPSGYQPERPQARDHLSFGFGSHYCIGAPLARLEARVVLEELASALPGMRLAAEQAYRYLPNTSFRSPRELWVEW